MAATVVLVITDNNGTILDLVSKLNAEASNVQKGLTQVSNYLDAIQSGCRSASVVVTVRDSSPTCTTSGSGSTQTTYNHS